MKTTSSSLCLLFSCVALLTSSGQTIILDPGHGGTDPGAVHGGIREKDVNLRLALQVEARLHDMGFNTGITRDKDVSVSLAKRAQLAGAYPAPIFVSLHYNGAQRAGAQGVETFYANHASRELARFVQHQLVGRTGAVDRSIKNGKKLHVVGKSRAPVAILIEGGFLSNPAERQRITDPNYREIQALAIASGIVDFLQFRNHPAPPPVARQPRPKTTV